MRECVCVNICAWDMLSYKTYHNVFTCVLCGSIVHSENNLSSSLFRSPHIYPFKQHQILMITVVLLLLSFFIYCSSNDFVFACYAWQQFSEMLAIRQLLKTVFSLQSSFTTVIVFFLLLLPAGVIVAFVVEKKRNKKEIVERKILALTVKCHCKKNFFAESFFPLCLSIMQQFFFFFNLLKEKDGMRGCGGNE